MNHAYHNTNRQSGPDLKESERKAMTQDQRVLAYFQVMGESTPSQVQRYVFGMQVPITSVRRAITNLTEQGLLEKTERMTQGVYGKPVHVWKLAPKPGQKSLF